MSGLKKKKMENEKTMILDEIRRVTDADFYKDSVPAYDILFNGIGKHCPKLAKYCLEHNVQPGRKEWVQLMEQTLFPKPSREHPIKIIPVIEKKD